MSDDSKNDGSNADERTDSVYTKNTSRRDALKAALKVGVYAAPVVLSASNPSPALAQVSPTGTLTGTISNASTAAPISGATVAVGVVSGLTSGSGVYSIPNAPAGNRSVQTSAPGFTTRTDPVNIAAGTTTNFSTSLVPSSASGNITIVLSWGAQPSDLDSHLVGPDVEHGGRFHCFFASRNPVTYVSLDVDDVTAFGPETITVSPKAGNFVPGSYSYFIHNFSGSPGFNVSSAIVTFFQGGSQIAQFLASAASGNAANTVWYICDFTLTATPVGNIVITTVQQFQVPFPTLPEFSPPRK